MYQSLYCYMIRCSAAIKGLKSLARKRLHSWSHRCPLSIIHWTVRRRLLTDAIDWRTVRRPAVHHCWCDYVTTMSTLIIFCLADCTRLSLSSRNPKLLLMSPFCGCLLPATLLINQTRIDKRCEVSPLQPPKGLVHIRRMLWCIHRFHAIRYTAKLHSRK